MGAPAIQDATAITLSSVSKVYRLYQGQWDQMIDVLGLHRLGLRPRSPSQEFSALKQVDLVVPKGQRLGIVGRNGSGKTTLLKLICGNFSPTEGGINVDGRVQALLSVGIGFHPDFTGRQNVEASLHYNGLKREEHEQALAGIIDFCELGMFIDQPFKTYSLGMQARLMFATATAIRPEILIVDEVLGAGDAYFVAKSKRRVETLIGDGCTMLLVSHSMSQILELCDRVVWLDRGRIVMDGEPLEVVKRYEESLQRSVGSLYDNVEAQDAPSRQAASHGGLHDHTSLVDGAVVSDADRLSPGRMQTPYFVPNLAEPTFPAPPEPRFDNLAPGGLSRWVENPRLEIIGFAIQRVDGLAPHLVCLQPGRFVIDVEIKKAGQYRCCYGLAVHDHLGNCVLRLFSPPDVFEGKGNERRQIFAVLNPCQLGPGEYTVGISITSHNGIEYMNQAERFDLLSRSFVLNVTMPDSLSVAGAGFLHSSEWSFNADGLPAIEPAQGPGG